MIKALSTLDDFLNLDRDIEGSPKRWKKLVDSEAPEKEKLPQEWKTKPAIQQMCILRTLRPDRMPYALRYAFAVFARCNAQNKVKLTQSNLEHWEFIKC